MYSLPDVIRMVESRGKRWVGRVESFRETITVLNFELKGNKTLGDTDARGSTILKWVFGISGRTITTLTE